MGIPARFYRHGIFLLLALVIAMGTGLSMIIAKTSKQVESVATPLLKVNIPLLSHVSQLEAGLLSYQVVLNQYFAYSITRQQFTQLHDQTKNDIENHLLALKTGFGSRSAMPVLLQLYQYNIRLGLQLDKHLTAENIDWDGARLILADLSNNMNKMRVQLNSLKSVAEKNVYEASEITRARVKDITRLVYLYSVATLLTALFVIHHIRARLRSESVLAYQAWHDVLTGLENRRAFERDIQAMGDDPHIIMFLVIERFERIISGLGHEGGEYLIQQMATRLKKPLSENGANLFRLEGATYALLYKIKQDRSEIEVIKTLLYNTMREAFDIQSCEVFVSMAMGGVDYPEYGKESVTIFRYADAALNAARKEGRQDVVFYSQSLNTQWNERLALEALLSHAVERHELELYYQPQLSLQKNQLIGFEALLRWNHDGKLISPAEFIPLAEESGLIVSIGTWVLETACLQAKKWKESLNVDIVVAVNISARQFLHPDFLSIVKNTLSSVGVNPAQIELEITESMVIQDADRAVALLEDLHQLGLKLAIDDFGTGYSSLAYLKRFPVHKLKIDQSFIRHLKPVSEDAAIVQAVIALGHALELTVIAEGVETAEQLEWLKNWSCDEIQGYHYGRPTKVEMATEFLQSKGLAAA
ncbi:MAG: bifunctional diguanylate cyclase/phosphodiesterase [Pseudomonadota bacterium]